MDYLKVFVLPILIIFLYQFFRYAVSRHGTEKAKACLELGATYFVLGILSLAFRTLSSAVLGFSLIMFGLILIAKEIRW